MKNFLLSWDAPVNSTVTDYIVQYSLHDNDWQIYDDGTSISTSSMVTGLDACSYYRFRVAATNPIGTGDYSNIVSGLTLGSIPSAPVNLIAVTGDRKFNLSWEPPIDNGGCNINDYIIEYYKNNDDSIYLSAQGTDNNYILFNLINNNPYSIRVAAVNAIGTGLYSTMLTGLIPISKPTPITTFYVYAETDAYVGITWEEPKTDLNRYLLEYSIDNIQWVSIDSVPSGTTYYRLSELNKATTYYFRISSFNLSLQSTHSQKSLTYNDPFDPLYNKTRLLLRMGDLI